MKCHVCGVSGVESQDHSHHAEEEHVHDHQSSKREHSHQEPSQLSEGSLASSGIAGGLVPCPGALVALLVAIALNRIAFGLTLIFSFSFGLAAVLTTIGVLMVVARSTLDRFAGGERFILRLTIASEVMIIALGFVIALRALMSGGILIINLTEL